MFNMQELPKNRLINALKTQDVDEAKRILIENPALQEYIDDQLYTLADAQSSFYHGPPLSLKKDIYREIQKLLTIGANPNYCPDTSEMSLTILDKAILTKDLIFVKDLLKQGANPLRNPTTDIAELGLKQNEHHRPIQRAYQLYLTDGFDISHKEMFKVLSKAIWEKQGVELEKQFKTTFKSITDEIQIAKSEAQKSGKRLMVLIGEEHVSLNSFLIELMVYIASFKMCDINTILTEQDQYMLDFFNKTGKTYTRGNNWRVINAFLTVVKENKATIVPIDIHHTELLKKEKEENIPYLDTEKGIAERDQTMAECANAVNSDVICVIGSGHLDGMLNKTDLQSHFYILPISATMGNKPPEVKFYNAFKHEQYACLLYPGTAKEIVEQLFKDLYLENKESSDISPSHKLG